MTRLAFAPAMALLTSYLGTSRTIYESLLLLAVGFGVGHSSLRAQEPTPPLLGMWHGTSICVKASWNASCNDEEIFYEFVPTKGGLPGILLRAAKRVGSAIEPMGDLEIQPDTGEARWAGEFSNSRVHIRWLYQVSDSGLTGSLILLPSMQVARAVRAQRDSSWGSQPAELALVRRYAIALRARDTATVRALTLPSYQAEAISAWGNIPAPFLDYDSIAPTVVWRGVADGGATYAVPSSSNTSSCSAYLLITVIRGESPLISGIGTDPDIIVRGVPPCS